MCSRVRSDLPTSSTKCEWATQLEPTSTKRDLCKNTPRITFDVENIPEEQVGQGIRRVCLPLRVFRHTIRQLFHERNYHRERQTFHRVSNHTKVSAVQDALQHEKTSWFTWRTANNWSREEKVSRLISSCRCSAVLASATLPWCRFLQVVSASRWVGRDSLHWVGLPLTSVHEIQTWHTKHDKYFRLLTIHVKLKPVKTCHVSVILICRPRIRSEYNGFVHWSLFSDWFGWSCSTQVTCHNETTVRAS